MRFRDLHRNVRIRLQIDFMQRIFNNMITSFMAIYLSDHFGVKVTGILIAIALTGGIIGSFYGGYYSDVKGRKKVLVMAEFLNFLIFAGMAVFNSPLLLSPLITYILYLFHIIIIYTATPAADAMIIDVSTPETRKYIYGLSYWVINLAFAVGALIGAFFYRDYFFYLLVAASLSAFVIFLMYLLYVEETKPMSVGENAPQKVQFSKIFSSYKQVFRDQLFLKFVIASLFLMVIEFQLGNYISVRLANEFGEQNLINLEGNAVSLTGVNMYGILRAENTILVIVLAMLIRKLTSKMSDRKQLLTGTVIFSAGYMVVGSSNHVWILLLAAFAFTIGEMMYVPVKQTLLSLLVKEDARTQYMAVYGLHFRTAMLIASSFISLGAFIPSIGMSALYGLLGLGTLFIFSQILQKNTNQEVIKHFSA